MSLAQYADTNLVMGRLFQLTGDDETLFKACGVLVFRLLSTRAHKGHATYLRGIGFPADALVQTDPMTDATFVDCQSVVEGLNVPASVLQSFPTVPDINYFSAKMRTPILVAIGRAVDAMLAGGAGAPAAAGTAQGHTRATVFGTAADLAAGRWGDDDILALMHSQAWLTALNHVTSKDATALQAHVHVTLDASSAVTGTHSAMLLAAFWFGHRAFDDAKDKASYNTFLEGMGKIKALLGTLGRKAYESRIHYSLANIHKDSLVVLLSTPVAHWLSKHFYCFATDLEVRQRCSTIRMVRRKGVDVPEYAFNGNMTMRQFGQAADVALHCLAVPMASSMTPAACCTLFGKILSGLETEQVNISLPTDQQRVTAALTEFLIPAIMDCERRRTLLMEYLIAPAGTTEAPKGNIDGFFPLEHFLDPVTGKDVIPALWANLARHGFRHASIPDFGPLCSIPAGSPAAMASPAFTTTNTWPPDGSLTCASAATAAFFASAGPPPTALTATPAHLTGIGLTPHQIEHIVASSPAPAQRDPGTHDDDDDEDRPARRARESRGQIQKRERKARFNDDKPTQFRRGRSPPRRRQRSPPPRQRQRRSVTPPAKKRRANRAATRDDYNRSYKLYGEKLLNKGNAADFKGIECPDEAQLMSGICGCAECFATWGFLHGDEVEKKTSRMNSRELKMHNEQFCKPGVLMPGHYQPKVTRASCLPT